MKATERFLMKKVERGFCHSLPLAKMGSREHFVSRVLCVRGWLRVELATARFPERLVMTAAGSWALATFDSDDRYFHSDVRAASENAARKAA